MKEKRPKAPKAKIDPKFLAAARELRDRYLEHVNSGSAAVPPCAKYDVSRALAGMPVAGARDLIAPPSAPALPAPAEAA